VATACGGVIFQRDHDLEPKVFDERLTALTSSTLGIGMLVCGVYLIAAMAQLCVGWWLDRRSLKSVFRAVVALQVPLAPPRGTMENYLMSRPRWRCVLRVRADPDQRPAWSRVHGRGVARRAYAVRYVLSFSATAARRPLVAWIYKSSGDFRLLYYVRERWRSSRHRCAAVSRREVKTTASRWSA